jgi:predicted O-methyltransferase YrrM
LWRGKVVDPEPDENTRAVLDHNRRLFADERLVTTLLPLRDGLTLSLRRSDGRG